jgi:hypothetical protein
MPGGMERVPNDSAANGGDALHAASAVLRLVNPRKGRIDLSTYPIADRWTGLIDLHWAERAPVRDVLDT